jgi:Fur family transcriptional regulator, peroxide stress response regulator
MTGERGAAMGNPSREFAERLKCSNIRPTYPRVRVLEYLVTKMSHPSVDDIYSSLIKEIPTLSKTTVYNTLKLFVDAGLANIVTIEESEMRYDIVMKKHGHFKCQSCGMIYDFAVNLEAIGAEGLSHFKIKEKNIIFRGLCPQCSDKEQEECSGHV